MDNLDLNKYRLAWKNENSFQSEKLSEIEILKFMKSASKIASQYRRSLLFDIIFKGILVISFLVLIFLLKNQTIAILSNSFLIFITVFGIFWQIYIYKKADRINVTTEKLKDLLSSCIHFYNGQYIKSIFVNALSSTLFFLCGSIFYLHFKYDQIPTFESDDLIVFTIGIIISYGLSAIAQIKQNNYQVKQLEKCIIEIEEDTFNELSIKKYKMNRLKNIVMFGIAIIIGVILFMFLIFGLYN